MERRRHLDPAQIRIGTEIAHSFHAVRYPGRVHALDELVWSKLSYVLGYVHPSEMPFDADHSALAESLNAGVAAHAITASRRLTRRRCALVVGIACASDEAGGVQPLEQRRDCPRVRVEPTAQGADGPRRIVEQLKDHQPPRGA